MKRLYPLFVILFLSACSGPAPVPDGKLSYIEVIKLEKPEYKEHIMVYAPKKEEGPLAISVSNSYFCISQEIEPICGTSPYIELPDDYLLLDWRWKRIFDPIINEEAILSDKWSDLNDIYATWGKDRLYVNRPIKEYYVVQLAKMKEYNGGQLKFPFVPMSDIILTEFSEEDWNRFSDEGKEHMRKEALQADSAYMEYKIILSEMITDGTLKELKNNAK